MCGIIGSWETTPWREERRVRLQRGMDLLHHRGPDGNGQWIDERAGIAMGHTRLSIIGLDAGTQPIVARDGRLVISVNGELYDFKEHRARLTCAGERFETRSDSEIALHHYRELGLDFVEQLRGEFAIALFDRERDRLVLVRDRFGVKPLYVHLGDERVGWGSEIKAVLAQQGVPRQLSRRAALHQLVHVMEPGTTAFEGIEQVEPGHVVVIQRRQGRFEVQKRRYWDMEFLRADEFEESLPAQHWIDGVREELIDAVRVRLEADVPVGCYLSGGIDSCSMLGLATPLQQSPVKAFTISFDHADFDESKIAKEMAESVGADQEILELGASDLYGRSYVRTLWHAERTFYNTLGVAKWHMSRRVRECGFKVVVTGEGSDEMFSGYPFFKRDHFLHGGSGQAPRKPSEVNQVFQGSILAESSASNPAWEALCGFTPAWIQPWILTHDQARALMADDVLEELRDYDPFAAIAARLDPTKIEGRHPVDRAQYAWCKTMLEGQILTWGGDRVDMGNSMESRPAFLDHNVAELARRIPPRWRIHEGTEKWVLREAMKGVLPRVLYEREKFAFMAPPSHTDVRKRAEVEALIGAHLDPERIASAGLFDADRVMGFVERWRHETDGTRATRNDVVVNHLLGLHLLHELFVDGDGSAPPLP